MSSRMLRNGSNVSETAWQFKHLTGKKKNQIISFNTPAKVCNNNNKLQLKLIFQKTGKIQTTNLWISDGHRRLDEWTLSPVFLCQICHKMKIIEQRQRHNKLESSSDNMILWASEVCLVMEIRKSYSDSAKHDSCIASRVHWRNSWASSWRPKWKWFAITVSWEAKHVRDWSILPALVCLTGVSAGNEELLRWYLRLRTVRTSTGVMVSPDFSNTSLMWACMVHIMQKPSFLPSTWTDGSQVCLH